MMGHRGRLTLISAATAGVLLALVFAGIVFANRVSEFRAARGVLVPAVRQAEEKVRSGGRHPDLAEITASNPELSLAIFTASGALISRSGPIELPLLSQEGVTQWPKGPEIVAAVGGDGGVRVVAAVPWTGRERATRALAFLLAILWGPLTACVAFAIWRASQATFEPLARLAEQAEAMSNSPLRQRLPVEGDDEFADFASQLNRFLDRLSDSVTRQEQFVADAAHELRTPLAVLRGSIETTLRRNRTDQEYREALRHTLAEAERLSDLVETLLQSAKPAEGLSGPADLEVAAEKAHARWVDRFAAAGVGLDLETEPMPALIGETEIAIVLDNLLSNALRASPPETRCRVRTQARDGKATVWIEDEGIGIREGQLDRVFERFTRGDEGRSREQGGFGIGLSVCRRLVSEREGTIRAEKGAVGTRLIIELPLG